MITRRDFRVLNDGFIMTPRQDGPGEYKALHFYIEREFNGVLIGSDCYIDADLLAQPIYPYKLINYYIGIAMEGICYLAETS